jgi:ATP phosphoribosyltransferase
MRERPSVEREIKNVKSNTRELVLALPSKGRLQEQSLNFLSGCGFDVRRVGNGREYVAKLIGLDDVDIRYFRPDEIPTRIEQGDAHAGITGEDLYREFGDGPPASCLLMPNLGFGAARLVVAVPQSWVDVSTMSDLDEAAMVFHQKHGRSLRVATKFSRLTRAFFAERGIVEYSFVGSLGATEGAPAAGVADFVVDLTSTGTTLAENHLKEITGGTVLQTQACLVASRRDALWSDRAIGALEHLVQQVEARMRAMSTLVLRFSVPSERASSIRQQFTEEYGCTLSSWRTSAGSAAGARSDERDSVVAMCGRMKLYRVVKFLMSSGAAEVIVDRGEFVFEQSSPAFDRFTQMLRHRDAGQVRRPPPTVGHRLKGRSGDV